VYDIQNNTTNALFDQPKLGVSSDKIVMTWNTNGFAGRISSWLLKSDLLAGGTSRCPSSRSTTTTSTSSR
jgi:hypothetical protein